MADPVFIESTAGRSWTPSTPGAGSKKPTAASAGCARRVGFDNERGKGDHKHLGNTETNYEFTDIPALLAAFWKEVEEAQ